MRLSHRSIPETPSLTVDSDAILEHVQLVAQTTGHKSMTVLRRYIQQSNPVQTRTLRRRCGCRATPTR